MSISAKKSFSIPTVKSDSMPANFVNDGSVERSTIALNKYVPLKTPRISHKVRIYLLQKALSMSFYATQFLLVLSRLISQKTQMNRSIEMPKKHQPAIFEMLLLTCFFLSLLPSASTQMKKAKTDNDCITMKQRRTILPILMNLSVLSTAAASTSSYSISEALELTMKNSVCFILFEILSESSMRIQHCTKPMSSFSIGLN